MKQLKERAELVLVESIVFSGKLATVTFSRSGSRLEWVTEQEKAEALEPEVGKEIKLIFQFWIDWDWEPIR